MTPAPVQSRARIAWILVRATTIAAVLVSALVAVQAAQAQTFTVLHRFKGGPTDGNAPMGLVRDAAGNLYGTTEYGGAYGAGTIFKLDTAEKITILFNFFHGGPQSVKDDGANPMAGLTIDALGNLYGTTYNGGDLTCHENSIGCGAVFRLDTTGKLTVLHRFHKTDGSNPRAGTTLDPAGNLYGTTYWGGPGGCIDGLGHPAGCGVVFKLEPTGKLTVLDGFTATNDGVNPEGELLLDAAGNVYGTTGEDTSFGDILCCGSVFKVDQHGNEIIFYLNGNSDGNVPSGEIARDPDGNLYGTTNAGGDPNCQCGTVFKVDATGHFTVLHPFTGGNDGIDPVGLVRDAAGNLYGITGDGGSTACGSGCGTVFKLDPSGNETILHRFGGSDGRYPNSLTLDAAGNLYGTTIDGGASPPTCGTASLYQGCGVVFKITP
jgi:uncharacterized repeat protein (TIGR03803 family)